MMDDIRTNLDERLAAWAGRHALSDARAEAIRRAVLEQTEVAAQRDATWAALRAMPPMPNLLPSEEWWRRFFTDLAATALRAAGAAGGG